MPHVATALDYIKEHGHLRVIPEPLVNYHCSTWSWGTPIWERTMLDLKGLLEIADACFPGQPELWDAFLGNLRKLHGDAWIAHHRVGAKTQADWETSRTLLLRAGFSPLQVGAVDLAGDLLGMRMLPWPGLAPGGLVLVARGARRSLVLAGRGEAPGRFLTALRQVNQGELLVLDWETQAAALYRSCDVLVLPYRGEGFGLPIAEAMATGLPVIATARGGAQDFLDEAWAYPLPSHQTALNLVDDLQRRAGKLPGPDPGTSPGRARTHLGGLCPGAGGVPGVR